MSTQHRLRQQKGGRSEYGVALLLLGLGAWAIVDALGVTDTASRGPVNARTVPIVGRAAADPDGRPAHRRPAPRWAG